MASGSKPRVAFIGLGAMGIAMATQLLHSSFPVAGFDINPATLETLVSAGGTAASSPAEAAAKASVVVIMVATGDHVKSALFAKDTGVVHGLAENATVIIHSTIPPSAPEDARKRLDEEFHRSDVVIIDAPVSGGSKRAANGTLSIMVSAQRPEDLERPDAKEVLGCMAQTVYPIPGGLGSALKVKNLNQVLCGIHIAAAAEIMGLAAVLGLDTRKFSEHVVSKGSSAARQDSWSWMFEDRVVRMLDENPPLSSATSIILKDVRIVNGEAEQVHVPLRLCKASQVVYERAVDIGLERADDSSVVEVFLQNQKKGLWEERAKHGALVNVEEEAKLTSLISNALACMHAVAVYEALAFAEGMGMLASDDRTKQWYDILGGSAAGSTMFVKGMPKMLESFRADGPIDFLVPMGEGQQELLVSPPDFRPLARSGMRRSDIGTAECARNRQRAQLPAHAADRHGAILSKSEGRHIHPSG